MLANGLFLRSLVVVCVLLAEPTAAQDTAPSDDLDIQSTEQEISVVPQARDSEIEERITDILRATGWYEAVTVVVRDGLVFLDGTAESQESRDWARDLAAKTQDVVAVVNRLNVRAEPEWSMRPALNEIEALVRKSIASLPLIALAVLILPLAWFIASLVARLVRWLLSGRIESPFLRDIIARAAAVPVFLLGLYIVLQVAGLTQLALSLVGGAGVMGIIVGFAFRDIAENFLASLLLSIRRPFRHGDFIDVDGREGTVQSMNTRSTILRSLEGNHIQIPNAMVFKSTIVNYSAAPYRRATVSVGIGYDASIAEAQKIIHDVISEHDAIQTEPAPLVLVDELGSSTVNLQAHFWFDGTRYSVKKVRSAILRLMKGALINAEISMPDDAREIVFPEGVPLTRLETRAEPKDLDGAPSPAQSAHIGKRSEPEDEATHAEGDLTNEAAEIDRSYAAGDIPEGETDLLAERADPLPESGPP